MIKRNWFFLLIIAGILLIYARRYSYLETAVVSHPDSQIAFRTEDGVLEQTWQPEVKMITGISVPFSAENDFSCDVKMEVFSDDYSKVLGQAVQKAVFREEESGEIVFDLGKTKLVQGERYRMRLSLLDPSEAGTLQISSGSNYGGCSISGEDVEQAAAFRITFAKSSRLFWLMASLLPLMCYTLVIMVLTGRKFEEIIGFSLLAEGMILYGFGLLGHLVWGIWAVYILAILSLLATVWIYNKKDICVKRLLSPGLWIFVFMFGVIILTSHGDWLGMRDDMRHWGIAVKDMFYYDSLARHVDSTVILSWYFPFASLIEYAFEYMNGMFSEDILLVAYQTMILSILLIVCRPLSGKGGKRLFLPVMVSMICIPVIFFPYLSSSIMVDALMMALITYVLICYYSDKGTKFNYICIACALAALTLTKDVGLVLAGMLAMILFVDRLVMQIRNKKLEIRKLFYPVACVFMILALFLGWQFYVSLPLRSIGEGTIREVEHDEVKNDNIIVAESAETGESLIDSTAIGFSGVTVEGLIKVLSGEGEEYQQRVWQNFVTELFDGETYRIGTLNLSVVDLLGGLTFLVLSMGYFGFWQEDKVRINTFLGAVWLASVVLCAFMLVVYWFVFPLYEAMELTSFARYFAPYLCGIFIAFLYLVCNKTGEESQKQQKKTYLVYALTFFFAISMPFEGIVVEAKDKEGYTTEKITYGHEQMGEILRSVAKRGDQAYFICSDSSGYSEYVFRNTVCPIISGHWGWDIVASEEIYQEKRELYGEENVNVAASMILSVEQWKEQLRTRQYVVVFHADELFIKSYAELFEDSESIEDGSIYQVICDGEDLTLRFIGKTGIKEWQ